MSPRTARWLVLLVAAAVYANTLGAGFVWDDHELVVENTAMERPLDYARQLLAGGDRWWRPLQRLSLLLDRTVWGVQRPAGFHLTNLLLHALGCLALLELGGAVGLGRLGSLGSALVFAVHPVHVEAVASISHRKELLALLFYLAGVTAYARARGGSGVGPLVGFGRRLGLAPGARAARLELFGWSYLCCLLAMLAKESAAVMFPLLVVLWEALFGPEPDRRRRLRRAALFLAPFAAVLALFWTWGYLGTLPRRFSDEQILWVTGGRTASLGVVLLTALAAFGESVRLSWVPWPLYLDRDFELAAGLSDPRVMAGAAVLGLYLLALAAARRRSASALFALSWLGLNLLPVINVVPLTYWWVAERFLYVPSVGIALLAGVGFERLRRARGSAAGRQAPALLAALLVVLALATARQNRVWSDEPSLWSHTLRHHPDSAHGNYGLGLVLRDEDDLAGAERHFRRALAASSGWAEPRYALAVLLWEAERFEEAAAEAAKVRQLEPGKARSRLLLGHASFRLEHWAAAARAYREVLEREPENLDARFNLALALARAGRPRQARFEVRRLLERRESADAQRLAEALAERLGEGATAAGGEEP